MKPKFIHYFDRMSEQEQIDRDRRALKRGAAAAALAGVAGIGMLTVARKNAALHRAASQKAAIKAMKEAPAKAAAMPLALPAGRGRAKTFIAPDPRLVRVKGKLAANASRNEQRAEMISGYTKRVLKRPEYSADLLPLRHENWGKAPQSVKRSMGKMAEVARNKQFTDVERGIAVQQMKKMKKENNFKDRRKIASLQDTRLKTKAVRYFDGVRKERDGYQKARDAAMAGVGLASAGAIGYAGYQGGKALKKVGSVVDESRNVVSKAGGVVDAGRTAVEGIGKQAQEVVAAGRKTVEGIGKQAEGAVEEGRRALANVRKATDPLGAAGKGAMSAPGKAKKMMGQAASKIKSGFRSAGAKAMGKLKLIRGAAMAKRLAHLAGGRVRYQSRKIGKVRYFGGRTQVKDWNDHTYGNPIAGMAGLQKVYVPGKDGAKHEVPAGVFHGQVIRSAYRQGKQINKWGGRAGGLGKDVVNVVRGKPREKDASGRTKKREWEKSWFKNAVGSAAAGAALAGGALAVSKSPKAQDAIRRGMRKVADAKNKYIPDWTPKTLSARHKTARLKTQDRVTEFASANPKILGQREKLLATLRSRARMGGKQAKKAAKVARRVATDVSERKGMVRRVKDEGRRMKAGIKKTALVAGAGALAGGAVMKAHHELPETKKRDVGTRVRNTLVGAAAGGYLGGMLHGGTSGYKGARIGTAIGAGMGLLTNPKRKVAIEELPTASFAARQKTARHKTQDGVTEFAVVGPKTAGKVLKSLGYGKRGGAKMLRPEGPLIAAGYTPKGSSMQQRNMRAVMAGVGEGKLKSHSVVVPREPVRFRPEMKKMMGSTHDPVGIAMHEYGHSNDRIIKRASKALEKRQKRAMVTGDNAFLAKNGKQQINVAIGLEKRANRKTLAKVREHGTAAEAEAYRRYANNQMKMGYRKPFYEAMVLHGGAKSLSDKKEILRKLPALRGKYTDLSRKGRVTRFDAIAADAGWDVRDPRGRSARVFAPGSRKRERREKKWHEKVENQRKIAMAVAAAGTLAGAGGGYLIGRKVWKGKSVGKPPVKPAKPVKPAPQPGEPNIWPKWRQA